MTVSRRPLLARQRAAQARMDRIVGQETWVRGRTLVGGVGEFFLPVKFATIFYEKPFLVVGAPEIETGTAEVEHFPEVDMTVSEWQLRPHPSGGPNKYYTGATLAVRVAGRTEQQVWVAYHFVGNALSSVNVE